MRIPAAAALLLTLPLSGCLTSFVPEHQETPPAPANLVVEISGSPGVTFQGSLGTAPASKSIEGQVPAQFAVTTAVAVAVAVTKEQEEGELTVRILRDGREVAHQTTSQPFGTVTLVYRVAL
jgi:hypothetical protein